MEDMMLIIRCNGVWNDNNYVGGESFGAVIDKNVTFGQLVDNIYTATGIDRTIFDIKIKYLVEGDGNCVIKLSIINDCGIHFIVKDHAEYKKIYVDAVVRDVGGSRPIEPTDVVPPSIVPPSYADDPHRPIGEGQHSGYTDAPQQPIAEGQHDFASSGGNDLISSAVGAFTSVENPLCNDDDSPNETAIADSSDDEVPNTYNVNEDETEANDTAGEENANDDRDIREYPEIRFSGSQFEDNPLQPYWVVPGAENCRIEPIRTEIPIFYTRDTFYRGAIFDNKEALKMALGQYALRSKFNYRIRRSCTRRFEASCLDVSCTFQIRAVCRPDCVSWHVVKFVSEIWTSMIHIF